MSPIQQMLLGVGAVAKKTYIEDIFSMQVWPGTSHTVNPKSIVNNLDLSTDGGLVWVKERTGGQSHVLFDTERGATKALECAGSGAEETQTDGVTAFNTNGFTVAGGGKVNDTGKDYGNWSWKKTPGFFDCIKYTGTGSDRIISHNLECVPGCMIIKKYNAAGDDWAVYHRGIGHGKAVFLNTTASATTSNVYFANTTPTSTGFTVNNDDTVNENGEDYICYLFGGGESTAATARSVNFNGGSDYLKHNSGLYGFGTGDFTIEFWFRSDADPISGGPGLFQLGHSPSHQDDYKFISVNNTSDNNGQWKMCIKSTSGVVGTVYSSAEGELLIPGQWYHVALVRHSSNTSLYINGTQKIGPISDSTNYNFDDLLIGSYVYDGYGLDGQISNFRIVKGSAVYTTSFIPPTEPLTSITNTLLLCCQDSTVTTATTKPGSYDISTNGSPSASLDSPFDDPAGLLFGESGSESVIKQGNYVGNATAGLEVYVGWQPQYLLIKNTSDTNNWYIWDSLRGIATNGDSEYIFANSSSGIGDANGIDLTPTGFRVRFTGDGMNGDGDNYIWMAIRMSDGYVGKPYGAGEGTSVFAIDYGSGSTTIPTFDSTFPVDFTMLTKSDDTGNRFATARLIQGSKVNLDQNNAATTFSYGMFDSNVGSITHEGDGGSTGSTAYIGFQWKRHAGFDVTMDKGTGAAKRISHSLAKVPEMMIRKSTSNAHGYVVYHKGLNGGTTPQNYWIQLASTDVEAEATNTWNDTAPTSTHFTVGDGQWVSDSGATFMTLLFASVSGVSKVGYYTGNASNSGQSITLGFQPRLLFIVGANVSDQRWLFDSTTGFNTAFKLNSNAVPSTAVNGMISATSTGFDLNGSDFNGNNQKFIYYAHA